MAPNQGLKISHTTIDPKGRIQTILRDDKGTEILSGQERLKKVEERRARLKILRELGIKETGFEKLSTK